MKITLNKRTRLYVEPLDPGEVAFGVNVYRGNRSWAINLDLAKIHVEWHLSKKSVVR